MINMSCDFCGNKNLAITTISDSEFYDCLIGISISCPCGCSVSMYNDEILFYQNYKLKCEKPIDNSFNL